MPPKIKFTKEDVVRCAVDIVREQGAGSLSARNIAAALGCSPQPIFSCFDSMDEVREAVIKAAGEIYAKYIDQELARGKYPPYKCSGMAYIRLAREERELFRLLFMRDRRGEVIPDDSEIEPIINIIMEANGISHEQALLLHLEMWVCVHGIATMLATSYFDISEELASDMITHVYNGVRRQIKEEKYERH